jgi:hypothetical protein
MERDYFSNQYKLEQNGHEIELDKQHFQPVFFANKVDDLRENEDAKKALM